MAAWSVTKCTGKFIFRSEKLIITTRIFKCYTLSRVSKHTSFIGFLVRSFYVVFFVTILYREIRELHLTNFNCHLFIISVFVKGRNIQLKKDVLRLHTQLKKCQKNLTSTERREKQVKHKYGGQDLLPRNWTRNWRGTVKSSKMGIPLWIHFVNFFQSYDSSLNQVFVLIPWQIYHPISEYIQSYWCRSWILHWLPSTVTASKKYSEAPRNFSEMLMSP